VWVGDAIEGCERGLSVLNVVAGLLLRFDYATSLNFLHINPPTKPPLSPNYLSF